MLVISRHRDEALLLTDERTGEQVRVVVVDIRGDKVRLGLVAPPEIKIDRAECIGERNKRKRQEASDGG